MAAIFLATLGDAIPAFAQPGSNSGGDSTTLKLLPTPGGGNASGTGGNDSVDMDERKIRATVRIEQEVRSESAAWRAYIDSMENSPEAIRDRNLALNPEDWQPTDADRARNAEDLARALDHDFIYPKGITRIPLFSVPVRSIGEALGIVEDLSPRIKYQITSTQQVSVIIYTINALPLDTLVSEMQKPGVYRMEWDMNDARGKRALPGTYVVEVVAANVVLLRKQILVP